MFGSNVLPPKPSKSFFRSLLLGKSFNDWIDERALRHLERMEESDRLFRTLRAGEVVSIPVFDIVVGDICQVKYGQQPTAAAAAAAAAAAGGVVDGVRTESSQSTSCQCDRLACGTVESVDIGSEHFQSCL